MLVRMVTGHHSMTEKTTNTEEKSLVNSYKKLSIQISLNGLSFCITDTIRNSIILSDSVSFKTEFTPYLVLKELKSQLGKHKILEQEFSEVLVVHKNNLFSLVPKTLFDEKELANYLKFNTKILANDHIVYDELDNQDIVCVYVPFTNINNYVFENFGEFIFKHSSTAILQTLLLQKPSSKSICYVHVAERELELVVLDQKKLLIYNQFEYRTKEDFLYYVLFTFEQLQLDVSTTKLRLFGEVEEGDELFETCYTYIKKVSVFLPKNNSYTFNEEDKESIDLTMFN
ncbi:hypothetical protein MTsPCn9_11810 [Croceitalea sp. MTPC9]|nr:hypothetical protein MTsPCn6_31830 [Croceitalea sp. MTPC6]GMN16245.1 hypothetical protein MTsPCn9_11810 [Croceitalea sp. MTPC9]